MEQFSDFIQTLKDRVKVSDIIGKNVQLKSSGMDRYKGLCPFHQEKSPSFFVNDAQNFYHCFGCGAHGDIISYTKETKALSFVEAVESLAKDTGLTMPNFQKKDEKEITYKEHLNNIMQFALNYFADNLQKPEYQDAKLYLNKRDISEEIIKEYYLGFAPKGNKIRNLFTKEKHKDLLALGLIAKNDKGEFYDLFQDRVIFPIFNHKNEPIAFGGRVLDDRLPKYLNSPETKLFKKKQTLYNFNKARKIAYKNKSIIITEGYMDVLALVKHGFLNSAAPLGTAFSAEHLLQLWQIVKTPTICLDGDEAGKKAMARIAHLALPLLKPGYSLKFITLPQDQDPDDFLKNHGRKAFNNLLENAENLSEIFIKISLNKIDINSPEGKAELENHLLKEVEKIQDDIVRKQYNNFTKNKLWELFRFKNTKGKAQTTRNITRISALPEIKLDSEIIATEQEIIYLFCKYPKLLTYENIVEEFCNLEFVSNENTEVQNFLLNQPDSENNTKICQDLFKANIPISSFFLTRLRNLSAKLVQETDINLENLWKRTQKLYFLAKMRMDYRDFLNAGTAESTEKALAILKDIKNLEEEIRYFDL